MGIALGVLAQEVKELPETKTYPDIGDDWHWVTRKGINLMCCGCRLVHRLKFRLVENQIQMKVDRDDRATAQARRKH